MAQHPSPLPPAITETRRPPSLLLVEAEPMMRSILRDFLEASLPGVYIHEASSTTRALRLMESSHPRIILVDFMLHDTDVVEFTRLVTAHYPEAAIVILSASHAEADVHAARSAGATDYVTKDRLFTDLIPALNQAVKGMQNEHAG